MRVLIIGAGYCGLAAALKLGQSQVPTIIAEASHAVGGLSRTAHLGDLVFESGPHIYFDKDPIVVDFWRSLVGDELRSHNRSTRLFYNGRYLRSPLSPMDALAKLGPLVISRMLVSFASAKMAGRQVENAEDWVVTNFGRELYERFFRVYNEKIWGLPSRKIDADWAGQRIKTSLPQMIFRSLVRDPQFIVKTFLFPDGGSESIYSAQERLIAKTPTTELRLNCRPVQIDSVESGGFAVRFGNLDGVEHFTHIISTVHLADLNEILRSPGRPVDELDAAIETLVYRNLVLVNLVLPAGSAGSMREHWIDIHDPDVQALRITNFSNYAVREAETEVALGIEYNCFEPDTIWASSDEDMVALARDDMAKMRLTLSQPLRSSVVRIPRAYPVYVKGYRKQLETIFSAFGEVDGLILAGRNSLFKWNNMHHSVRTGQMAAENVLGATHDIGAVRGNVTIGKDSD